MKHLLFSVLLMNGPASDPVATSQSWQEFPTKEACVAARNAIVTGDRIIDSDLKRVAITLAAGSKRQQIRREGTCIPAE